MEEKFNNEQEKDNLDSFKNIKTTRRREKENVKRLALGLRWLFSFINPINHWSYIMYWSLCQRSR